MNSTRFRAITARYPDLRIAVIGDCCLDRYLEIDPNRRETSLETGLPVHNVVSTRSSPGAAGTILNNLVALGIGTLFPIGFAGEDVEGRELSEALRQKAGVLTDFFLSTPHRRTFCYTKPLVLRQDGPPEELSRLDFKNWTPTPPEVERSLCKALREVGKNVDALIVMDQVDIPETGVVTARVRETLETLALEHPDRFIIADSRRGLSDYPPLTYKMNASELSALRNTPPNAQPEVVREVTDDLANELKRPAFVTLAERGLVGASPGVEPVHIPALPIRGPIDIVGAGDAVTANLTAAYAAGAKLAEALELANAAASTVIHQLGTTGTASVSQLAERLLPRCPSTTTSQP